MNITDNNFMEVALDHYDDIAATEEEFNEDVKRFLYIKRLFNTYLKTNELRHRLILNHIIVITNVFGSISIELLFHELKGYESILAPFLLNLNLLPEKVGELYTTSIELDMEVVKCLREK